MAFGDEKISEESEAALFEILGELFALEEAMHGELVRIRKSLEMLGEIAEPARGWRLPAWLRR